MGNWGADQLNDKVKRDWVTEYLDSIYWKSVKASLSARCLVLRCQASHLPCHLPENSLVCGHSPHTTVRPQSSQHNIKYTAELTRLPSKPHLHTAVWRNMTSFITKEKRASDLHGSSWLRERRRERSRGVTEEGDIKTDRRHRERGGLACWQRPVVRHWIK